MAGNIVKWWKHKILGGYKQFSVQECTTDSEELMYHQVRASSSCSAPPDLLLVSDREHNIPLRSPVVNIITTNSTGAAAMATAMAATGATTTNTPQTCLTVSGNGITKHHHHHHQQQQQLPHQQHLQHQLQQHQQVGVKEATSKHLKISSKNNSNKLLSVQQQQQQQHQHTTNVLHQHSHHAQQQHQHQHNYLQHQHQHDDLTNEGQHQSQQHQQQQQQQQQHSHQRHSHHGGGGGKEERIRLEEFTCDVSVEGGKSSQPLQFSFTFYDLDGHHGKITKDDIVGIVYTIYESIGKSVVVPHCGSKTINVRLTVSPEGKSKASNGGGGGGGGGGGAGGGGKLKRMPTGVGTGNGGIGSNITTNAVGVVGMLEHSKSTKMHAHGMFATSSSAPTHHAHHISGSSGGHHAGHTRRQHRYRPRKLIRSDDEDDDSNSDKERKTKTFQQSNNSAINKDKLEQQLQQQQQKQQSFAQDNPEHPMEVSNGTGSQPQPQPQVTALSTTIATSAAPDNALYANLTAVASSTPSPHSGNINNAKRCSSQLTTPHGNAVATLNATSDCCGDMSTTGAAAATAVATPASATTTAAAAAANMGYGKSPTDAYTKQAASRVKMLRKARKQKYQDQWVETRQRSLSVGNEASWKSRQHLHQQINSSHQEYHHQNQFLYPNQLQLTQTEQFGEFVDGVQLRHPHRYQNPNMAILNSPGMGAPTTNGSASTKTMAIAQKRNSAECWKTALNRNDLISIIRESMEKNRLCFQMSGKPQANVSPIRQSQHHPHPQQLQQQYRQRSNTVSKIPMLIVNHPTTIISQQNLTNSTNMKATCNNNNTHHHGNNNSNINRNSNSSSNTTTTTINNNNNINSHHNSNKNNTNSNQSSSNNNNSNSDLSPHDNSSSSLYHPQPHIPIYHQQMAINPAVLAAQQQQQQNGIINGHNKINLCGYDSFLHATICGGGTQSHSPPLPSPMTTTTFIAAISNQPTIQPIATVQPILTTIASSSNANTTKAPAAATTTTTDTTITTVPNQQHTTPKIFVSNLSSTPQQIKTSKILRSGSYNSKKQQQQQQQQQQQHHSATNSPQYHGYQRLASSSATLLSQQLQTQNQSATSKHNLAVLNQQHPANIEKLQVEQLEEWLNRSSQKSRKDAKNYDNMLYAKLSERLRDNTLDGGHTAATAIGGGTNKENSQRRHRHRFHHSKRTQTSQAAAILQLSTIASTQYKPNSNILNGASNAMAKASVTRHGSVPTYIPIHGDPIECENLLSPTTDEETSNELNTTQSVETTKNATAETAAGSPTCLKTTTTTTTTELVHNQSNVHVPTATLVDLNDESNHGGGKTLTTTTTTVGGSDVGAVDNNDEDVEVDVHDAVLEDHLGVVGGADDLIEDENDIDEDDVDVNTAAAIANTSISSASTSLIHRYVHEHIHHHYHHFEEKDE